MISLVAGRDRGVRMSQSELVRQLQQLSELRGKGAITDAEFAAAKQQLLTAGTAPNSPGPAGEPPMSGTQAVGAGFVPPNWPGNAPSHAGWNPAQPASAHPAPAYSAPADLSRTPNQPSTGSKVTGHGGAVTSAVAGAVLLLSFLVLPMATVPFLGSISGSGVAGQSSLFGLFGLLWLVPVEALGIMGIAALQIMVRSTLGARRARSLAIIVIAGGVWATYIVVLVSLQTQVSEISSQLSISAFLGAGLWFALVAAAVAAVGGLVEMTSRG
jgi:hypothetical protein